MNLIFVYLSLASKGSLPGHLRIRQRFVCTFGPKHELSIPTALNALMHERDRVLIPRPHEALQCVQSLHGVKPMSLSPCT